jgi:phenylalanine-4-hydroxylase
MEEIDPDFSSTPPEIKENLKEAKKKLIPLKSSALYDKCYQKFLNYLQELKLISNVEDVEKIRKVITPKVVLAYFNHISKEKAPSSLWSIS